MIGARNTISASQGAARLRGTDQQLDTTLLAQAPRAPVPSGLWPTQSHGMGIDKFGLNQRSGSADLSVGIGFRLVNRTWKFYLENPASTFINDTADAQEALVGANVPLGVATTATGFVILSTRKFQWVSIDVSTASTTNGLTATVAVTNNAGTGFTTVPAGTAWIDDFTVTAGTYAVGELLWAGPSPSFWGKTTGIAGLPDGYYGMRVFGSTQGAAAAVADAVEIGTIVSAREDVDDNGTFGEEECAYWEPYADAVVAMFSTGAAGNFITAEWVHRG